MLYQKYLNCGLFCLAFLLICCNGDGKGNPTSVTPVITGKPAYGTVKISLETTKNITTLLGVMYDGPTPSTTVWEAAATDGCCQLLKPRTPFCTQPCGSNAACVENDSCVAYPKKVTVGQLNINGFTTAAGATECTLEPIVGNYQAAGATKLAYPPCNEGDLITFTAAGDTSADGFTISLKGISPLVVLNPSIVLADGQPINLQWTPPAQPGNSTIEVVIDISYHGGTKGKIECECDDNGSLTIPASQLDQLKALGISGFPKIEITRRAIGTSPTTYAKIVLESKVTMQLQIPGIVSCNSDTECPDGTLCQSDHVCR